MLIDGKQPFLVCTEQIGVEHLPEIAQTRRRRPFRRISPGNFIVEGRFQLAERTRSCCGIFLGTLGGNARNGLIRTKKYPVSINLAGIDTFARAGRVPASKKRGGFAHMDLHPFSLFRILARSERPGSRWLLRRHNGPGKDLPPEFLLVKRHPLPHRFRHDVMNLGRLVKTHLLLGGMHVHIHTGGRNPEKKHPCRPAPLHEIVLQPFAHRVKQHPVLNGSAVDKNPETAG